MDVYNFKSYPNPFDDYLTVSSDLKDLYSIKIFDIHGKTIKKKILKNSNNKITINTSKIAQGMYFLELKNYKTSLVSKIIKN